MQVKIIITQYLNFIWNKEYFKCNFEKEMFYYVGQ